MAGRLRFVRWDLDRLVEQVRSVCIIDADGCWLWNYRGNKREHRPIITISKKQDYVSRWVLSVTTGHVGEMALHTCDRPRCCNPEHLYWGTHVDNMRDMDSKGRRERFKNRPRGTKHGQHKLTEDEVIRIRERHASGVSMYRLALDHGVSRYCIRQIIRRNTWTHV